MAQSKGLMGWLPDISELLEMAFQLAYFIHPEKPIALRIATEALAKLEIACTAQDKRLYYKPTGRLLLERTQRHKHRTKVSMSELHLLQRLVYIESEPYEQAQERSNIAGLSEEDMIIRFIKHLVRITIRRNSFYVTLGLSRLLHNYSTAETMEIYNLVVQDPERVRDDSYYRSCKGRLMNELQERFGNLLKIVRGQRGEERFHVRDDPDRHVGLVKKCLILFTPWKTRCVLPESLNPMEETIPPLTFEGDDPDEEHPVELNRIHSLLHPDCHSRLIGALGFDPPEKRLALPHFSLSREDHQLPRGDRYYPPQLAEEEVAAVQNELNERAARRRVTSGRLLLIVVDGIERARLDPIRTRQVQLELEENAELIEVRALDEEGEVVLATCLLTQYERGSSSRPHIRSIVLEGGQKLSFTITLSRNLRGEIRSAIVDVEYRETNLIRAAARLLRQLKYRVGEVWSSVNIPALKPALAFVLIVASAVVAVLSVRWWRQADSLPSASPPMELSRSRAPEPLSASGPSAPITPSLRDEPHMDLGQEGRKSTPAARRPAGPPSGLARMKEDAADAPMERSRPAEGVGEDVEGVRGAATRASLISVRRIYVESLGDDPISQKARNLLIGRLRERFIVTNSRKDADAVIRGIVFVRHEEPSLQLTVRLINAAGDVLWTTTRRSLISLKALPLQAYPLPRPSESRAPSLLDEALREVITIAVKDLIDETERSRQKRE
ncbi:MAG: hypothetical protein QW087_08090 [Methanomassiliicoccales archaeon]